MADKKAEKPKQYSEKKLAELAKWQERFKQAEADYSDELDEMFVRDRYYNGDKSIYDPDGNKAEKGASTTRNLCFELIESQVEASWPTPKVTPYSEADEELAYIIEDALRNEMDRLPIERLNDMDERTTTIQGGDFFLVEWDSSVRTHTTIGELSLQVVHPRKVIPQKGVESLLQSDWVFLKLAQTKEYIKRRYKVDVSEETEEFPQIRGEEKKVSDNMVTQIIAFYRNEEGGVGIFSWVNDVIVEDLHDYQARVQKHCKECDAYIPAGSEECPICGSKKLEDSQEDYYELDEDIVLYDKDGNERKRIPAMTIERDEYGEPVMETTLDGAGNPLVDFQTDEKGMVQAVPRKEPKMVKTRIPYYKPNMFPLIMRKNVSLDGKWLGNSDIDFIRDQQNETNKYMTKVSEKTMKGGSLVTLPETARMETTDEEMKIVKIKDPNEKALIGVFNLQADSAFDLQMIENNYQYARQEIGITDSFQGRTDNTALSGAAKQFSANQAAGRFESKKVMKRAMYAELYECCFKFLLAYADEPREFRAVDKLGNDIYRTFNKYEFLEQDAAGEWYWNDRFMFSSETTSNILANREALWQETKENFQYGTFGAPTDIDAQLRYWITMEALHYPTASTVRENLERQKAEIQQMQQMQMQQQAMMVPPQGQQMPM